MNGDVQVPCRSATLAGGVLWYWGLFKDIKARSRLTATPAIGPRYGGVSLNGRF